MADNQKGGDHHRLKNSVNRFR